MVFGYFRNQLKRNGPPARTQKCTLASRPWHKNQGKTKQNSMKLHFTINYHTHWGERVEVVLRMHLSHGKVNECSIPLDTADGSVWKGDYIYTHPAAIWLEYHYVVRAGGLVVRSEWKHAWRKLRADMHRDYFLPDSWLAIPSCDHLYSAAFNHSVQSVAFSVEQDSYYDRSVVFRIHVPQLAEDELPAIIGSIPAMGAWQSDKAMPLVPHGLHEWGITLSAEGMQFPFEYKYVIINRKTGKLIRWEEGENRTTQYKGLERNQILVYHDGIIRLDYPHKKMAGVVIPLFSIRTEKSWGVGDFGDLMQLTDWAASVDMSAIQLLPVYDTNTTGAWTDSYPYNCISVYALHLQYLDMNRLNPLADHEKMEKYRQKAVALNQLQFLDYEAVYRLKSEFLEDSFLQDGAQTLSTPDFKHYFEENSFWLIPYAAYVYLREQNGTSDFDKWKEYAQYESHKIQRLLSSVAEAGRAAQRTYYTQFLLYQQMKQAHDYARSQGVLLKGDIPIGVCRSAVDVWMEPYYFNRDGQAGAPPDAFSVNGQNWGFPTYNWDAILENGCRWWTRRLEKMSEFFDAYRIDHVLGFFRIWEIPTHAVHGLLGYFTPALPLTVDEIRNYGLDFRKDAFTRPYIADWILDPIFGEEKDIVKRVFLNAKGYDWYEMKPEFQTQRQVEHFFARQKQTEKRNRMKEGIYELISNVLFVEDPHQPAHYHPRISAMQSSIFQTLTQHEKECFARLYEDFYYHRHNKFWYQTAMQKLPRMIEATDMLPCAEDLGMVPECVKWVLEELQILTLEIQTMPKGMDGRFAHLENNPYKSVATIFTHDMPTLRLWWREDPAVTLQYYHEILQKDGKAPEDIPAWLCEEVISRHLFSPSMLCLISWQDWTSMSERLRNPDEESERINIPAHPRHYWRYRMHLTVEQLKKEKDFNEMIRTLILRSGRSTRIISEE